LPGKLSDVTSLAELFPIYFSHIPYFFLPHFMLERLFTVLAIFSSRHFTICETGNAKKMSIIVQDLKMATIIWILHFSRICVAARYVFANFQILMRMRVR
jgi:hypothetical protein